MSYTPASTAAACGVNKSTVLRSIKFGKVSGTKDENGEWQSGGRGASGLSTRC